MVFLCYLYNLFIFSSRNKKIIIIIISTGDGGGISCIMAGLISHMVGRPTKKNKKHNKEDDLTYI